MKGYCWLFGLCFFCCQNQVVNQDNLDLVPPNIIYILVDDLGYADLSCYGQQNFSTPHIDALAVEGMRFTQHYAGSTVCAPSRASLLTGKHTGHCSVRGNNSGQLLRDDEETIPKLFQKAGYRSAMIGKWGVGHPPAPDDPLRCGFNEYYGYVNMWHAHNFFPEFLYRNGLKEVLPGNVIDSNYAYEKYHPGGMPEGTGVAREKTIYALDKIEDETLAFIERNQKGPFFLYMSINLPHANNESGYFLNDGMEVPVQVIDGRSMPNYGDFQIKEWPNPEKGFAQMITLLDQTVGMVMAKLEALQIKENTLVIFTSDNGPHQEGGHSVDFFNSNGALRGHKRDLYEGGIRVPMIACWPGKIKAGSTTGHISAFWDVLPTFCDIIQVNTPEKIDGISFLPTLLGEEVRQEKHPYLYWEFYEAGGRQALRQDHWKYIRLNVRDTTAALVEELYNLSIDPGEHDDIKNDHPELLGKFRALTDQAHESYPGMTLVN